MHPAPTIPAKTVASVTASLIEDAHAIAATTAPRTGLTVIHALAGAFAEWFATILTQEGGDDTATAMAWGNAVWADLIANGYDLNA